jgi:hypothetical protein
MKAERPIAMRGAASEAEGFAVSVAMEQWGPQHRAVVVEMFF